MQVRSSGQTYYALKKIPDHRKRRGKFKRKLKGGRIDSPKNGLKTTSCKKICVIRENFACSTLKHFAASRESFSLMNNSFPSEFSFIDLFIFLILPTKPIFPAIP